MAASRCGMRPCAIPPGSAERARAGQRCPGLTQAPLCPATTLRPAMPGPCAHGRPPARAAQVHGAKLRRQVLCNALGIDNCTGGALVTALNRFFTRAQYEEAVRKVDAALQPS